MGAYVVPIYAGFAVSRCCSSASQDASASELNASMPTTQSFAAEPLVPVQKPGPFGQPTFFLFPVNCNLLLVEVAFTLDCRRRRRAAASAPGGGNASRGRRTRGGGHVSSRIFCTGSEMGCAQGSMPTPVRLRRVRRKRREWSRIHSPPHVVVHLSCTSAGGDGGRRAGRGRRRRRADIGRPPPLSLVWCDQWSWKCRRHDQASSESEIRLSARISPILVLKSVRTCISLDSGYTDY